jgi:hypothetical protein
MQQGLLTKIFTWGVHPSFSEGDTLDWLAGLVVILLISLLWSQVVMQIA